jgi:hypothetical protein
MVSSDSYSEQPRWKGWLFVLLIVAICILLLNLLG